jgi:mono/diheme cytochrome c family protein
MATVQVLGLFHEAAPTADTIDHLRAAGVPDGKITILSGIPYRAEILGRSKVRQRLGLLAAMGGAAGLVSALLLVVGTVLLYPLYVGGQPLVPIPPSLIILFELMMLGTMWATFFGLLFSNRLPVLQEQTYDARITEGHIGVLAEVDEMLADRAEQILRDNGAHHMDRVAGAQRPDPRFKIFWAAVIGAVVFVVLLIPVFTMEIIKIPFPSQMVNQDSVGFEQGPRLAAPAEAIPVQGAVLIAGQPATQPIPATANSLQRGQVLFNINCVMCHGAGGKGDGPIGAMFPLRPADLTSDRVQSQSDDQLYLVLTEGRGLMPSMAEHLSRVERWDVINHVRSLKQ